MLDMLTQQQVYTKYMYLHAVCNILVHVFTCCTQYTCITCNARYSQIQSCNPNDYKFMVAFVSSVSAK